jgi:hypothetical protein
MIHDRISLIIVAVLVMGVVASAQTPEAVPVIAWYGTQAGIIGATAIGVSILKRLLGNLAYANSLPTWLYAVGVAGVLTYLSVRVWHTMPGNLWPMVSQSVLSAGASSGFYEWITAHPTTSLATSAVKAGVAVDPVNLPNRDALPVITPNPPKVVTTVVNSVNITPPEVK